MNKLKYFYLVLLVLLIPAVVSAYTYDVELLPEGGENMLELVNMVISIIAAGLAIKLAALSQGGHLEKTWNWLAVSACLFAVLEVIGALKGFNLVHLGGADDIAEFLFIVVFVTVFYRTRKDLLKQVMG